MGDREKDHRVRFHAHYPRVAAQRVHRPLRHRGRYGRHYRIAERDVAAWDKGRFPGSPGTLAAD